MVQEYRIVTIADIANLPDDKRGRCLIDLRAWFRFRDQMQPLVDAGLVDPITEMIWRDDDRVGECSGVRAIDRKTGKTVIEEDW